MFTVKNLIIDTSKKLATIVASTLFVFSSLVIPVSAQVFYPGNPGQNRTSGAYSSYEYSFCYYNTNGDLECFDSANNIGVTKQVVSINGNTNKFNVTTAEGGATVRYRASITNNLNPARPLTTVYIREYLPDIVNSVGTPTIITSGTTATNSGSFQTSNNSRDLVWNGNMASGQSVFFEFDVVLRSPLNDDDVGPHTNTICASVSQFQNGAQVDCGTASFSVVPTNLPQNTTDLSLEKGIVGANSFEEGDTVTYRFRITNNGNTPVSSFVINDNFAVDSRTIWPGAFLDNFVQTGSTATAGSVAVNSTNNTITWSGATLNPNQSVIITVNATVRQNLPLSSGNYGATNRACVQIQNDTTPSNDCGAVVIQIIVPQVDNPRLGIEKQIRNNTFRSITPSQAGQSIPYQVTITNISNQDISEFFIIDVLPPALVGSSIQIESSQNLGGQNFGTATIVNNSTDIRWNASQGNPLQPLQSVVINFRVNLNNSSEFLQTLVNTIQRNDACVRLTANGRNEGCHYDWFNIVPNTRPTEIDLQLFKGKRFGRTGFRQGEEVVYEFIVTNLGSTPVTTFTINESSWPVQLEPIQGNTITVQPAGTATLNGQNIVWNAPQGNNPLANPGGSVTIYATARVRNNLNITETTPAVNRACVEHPNDPSNGSRGINNCRNFQINIVPQNTPEEIERPANIQKIIANASDQAFATNDPDLANKVRYSITVANTGNTDITNFQIRENLPNRISGITGVTMGSGPGQVTVTNANTTTPIINWTGTLTPGQEVVINYRGVLVQNLDVPAGQSVNQTNTARLFIGDNQVGSSSTTFTIFNGQTPPTSPDIILQKFISRNQNITNPAQLSSNIIVSRGDNITYYFLVSNAAGPNITTFQINESQFPQTAINNLTNARVVAGGGSVALNNNNITWNGTLTTGNFVLIAADSVVRNDAPAGAATNTATVPPLSGEINTSNNTSTATIVVITNRPQSGIGIQKVVVGPNIAIRGETTQMRYRLQISNNSNQAVTPTQANPIIITEQLPTSITPPLVVTGTSSGTAIVQSNGTTIHWYGATIPAGGLITIDFTANLNLQNTPHRQIERNIATATFGNNPPTSDDAEFTVSDPNNPEDSTGVDLHLEKSAERIAVRLGDTIVYRFRITNTKNNVFNGTVTINEDQWPSQFVSNILTVDQGATISANNTITWTGTISPRQSITITATAAANALGSAVNIASINTSGDDNPNNNTDRTTVTIVTNTPESRGLGIQKVVVNRNATPTNPRGTAQQTVRRGTDTTVRYRISISNNTPNNVTAFTVLEEQWPNVFANISQIEASRGTATLAQNGRDINWTGTGTNALTPGNQVDIYFTGTLRNNLTAADEGTHTNVATVIFEGVPRSDDADFTITPPGLNPERDLGIQKEADRVIVAPNGTVNYRFTITNHSAQDYSGGFIIEEQWPEQFFNNPTNLEWSFGVASFDGRNIRWEGNIRSGAVLEITFRATARNVEGSATNFAILRNLNGTPWQDSNPQNDRDQTTITIRRGSSGDPIDNVEKTLNGNTRSVAPGAPVIFTASFTNNSQQTISSVTITERETNFTINSITANRGTITGTTPNFTWNGGQDPLRPGETLIITIAGTVANRPGESMQNFIRFDNPRDLNNNPITDPNPNNNEDETIPVPIEGDPIDNVTKTVNGNLASVATGQQITFTATVTNRSGVTVTRYTITELATGLRVDRITASTGTITGNYPNYTWTGSLANNQTLTLTITGTVTAPGGQNIVNRITFSDAQDSQNRPITDPDPSDNTAQTPPIPIRRDGPTPITGGGVAIIASILTAATVAGAGFYFYRKRGEFKISK